MIDVETFKSVKDDLFLRSTRIPNWLDTSSEVDYWLWAHMRSITDIILQMVATKTLNEKLIFLKAKEASEHYDRLAILAKNDILILISNHILKFIEKSLSQCELNELYESASNLVRFNDYFYVDSK
jgi:hypothetical protein